MSTPFNQNFEESASPAAALDSQSGQTVQAAQPASQASQATQQPQLPPQPVAQLGGSDFLAPLPIPNPPNATASTSSSPPRTLWMGDLDPWSDEEAIENLWESLGKRVLVKLIKAKRGTPAANLNTGHAGYCFVEFENYDEAKSALALNGSQIPNTTRLFRLNWASGATLSSPIPQSPEYSLFVGDLSPSTTEAHLLALFQTHFKSVKTVRVMTDPITGTSRCFGFVRFSDEEERRRALTEMSGVWCAGRPLRVALATPRNQTNMLSQFPNQFPGQFGQAPVVTPPQVAQQQQDMVLYPYQHVPSPMPSFYDQDSQPNQAPMQSIPYSDPNNTTVFVGGLAAGVSENMLAQLFQPFGPIVHIKIPPNKGCGFIRFETREDAVNAINAMQGFAVGGSRIRLSWGRQQNQQRLQMAMAAAMQGSPHPLQSLNSGLQNLSNVNNNGYPGQLVGNVAPAVAQVAPPVNNMYFVPTEGKPFGYDYSAPESQYQQQPVEYENTAADDRNSVSSRETGHAEEKLQEMYRAAVAGKLDSLN